jgi:dCMP deaminase
MFVKSLRLIKSKYHKNRPSKIQNFMDMAVVISQRSHDEETKVGALLINNESSAILATGYNGFVRGANDKKLPTKRPKKYEYMLHAEQNLISNCAKHGISMQNSKLICTLSPCKLCMRMLFNCGITEVIVKELYKDFNDILQMKDIKVECKKSPEDGFYRIRYSV